MINQPYISTKTSLVMNFIAFVNEIICDSNFCYLYELFEIENMWKMYMNIIQCRLRVDVCFIM